MKENLFTHLDTNGQARMVDITGKTPGFREAKARGFVRCSPAIMEALRNDTVPKGDALAVARVAGIASAKKTVELLPIAHPIAIHYCAVDLQIVDQGVEISAVVRTVDRTGIEMEALTAVSVAGLALVDMVKGVDKMVSLENCYVVEKTGGKSGTWKRQENLN